MRTLSHKTRRRLLVAALLLAPATVPMALVAQDMSNEEQKDFLTNFVQDRLSTPERQIRLSNIDGVLGSNVSINEITISDAEGVWLRVNDATLNWNQAALFLGRLEVTSLRAESIEYVRNAIPVEGAVDLPSPESSAFEVPEFPVAIQIGELAVPSVTFGENVFGLGSEISLAGSLWLEGGNLDAVLDIIRLDGPGGTLDLDIAYSNETQEIDLGLALVEPPDGVIANLLNIEGRPSVELTLDGTGPVSDLEAQLNLLADGRQALAGTAIIAQGPEGYNVTADLGGPLSTLVAEPYRPFFGLDTRLTAQALVRDGGGFDISALTLSGGQLDLSASASTTSDNFLRQLDLTASIADLGGDPVTLPVATPTRIQAAQLQVQFGTTSDENWQSVLEIEDFETDGFAAETFALNIGGVARNLEDPATRMVTFNGDGTLAGIEADPGVEAALGDSVGLGIAGLWNAGEPIELAELRVVGQALTAALAGQIDGLDFDGRIQIETDNIAPFSGLAGRDLAGALDLAADGRIMPISGGFDLVFDGTGTDLTVDEPTADALLDGTVTLSGRLARTTAGISAQDFTIANAQVQFSADGAFATEVSDFNIALDLADLALLSDQASGALSVRGSARSTTPEEPLMLMLDGQVASGELAGYPLRDAQVNVAANLLDGAIDGDVTGSATLDGNPATLSTRFQTDATRQALSNIAFEIAGTRVSGDLTRLAETGLLEGRLDLSSPDIALAAALLLTEASGAVNATVALTPEGTTQSAAITASASNLVYNDIEVGRAQITASLADLFGVPMIDGNASASDVDVAGISIDTLDARASQAGDTTNFDAQARLATGTDVDVAGALSPTAGGYRLALDRAELMQGSLSARLANPTAIELGGDRIALDAVRFNVGSGSITATGTAGETLDVVVDIAQLPLSIANAVAPELGLSGTVNGRAVISGAASDPQVRFQAAADGISAAAISDLGITPLSVTASGSYRNQVLALESLSANGNGGVSVQGSGVVPFNGASLAVSLTGSAPLTLANRFVVDRGGVFSGTAGFGATISGSLSAPQFSGSLTTNNASYIDPELNLRLTDIAGRVGLNGTTATIEALSANLATGGTVSAQGTIGLTGGLPADLAINLNGARYTDGDIFVATLSGALNVTGDITGSPLLSGQVLIEEANVTVPDRFGGGPELIAVEHVRTPRPVQETLNRARVNARTGAAGTSSGELQLDVTIRAPNQIFVRGRGLNAEVGGEVRLTGSISDIQPVGSFSLNRGRFDVLGQRLEFETGTVTLTGNLDPQLYFVARTEGDGITVFITIAGRVSEPQLTFRSNPDLPQDEVLSRLIFNRSVGELSTLQLARLAGAAAELFGGENLVDSARDAAGLDELDIVTDDAGNVGVRAGAYVQDNVYVDVTAGTGGQSKVAIEIDATDELTVRGSVAADGRSSVGVYFEQDY